MSKYLVFWTGGLDSTYLILKHIFMGHSIDVGYVYLENNEVGMSTESEARRKIMKDLKKIMKNFPNAKIENVESLAHVEVEKNYGFSYLMMPTIFQTSVYSLENYKEIQIAYVHDDYSGVSVVEHLTRAFNEFKAITKEADDLYECKNEYAELTFPLMGTTKQEEILTIEALDRRFGTHILENLVHCEHITTFGVSCGECDACKNYKEQLETLNYKE